MATASNIDEYIAQFPPEIKSRLQQMRTTIQKAAPEAEEAISYAMPTFKLNGNLVHFAAFKNHIGFYPAPRELNPSRKSSPNIKELKDRSSFHTLNPCPYPW